MTARALLDGLESIRGEERLIATVVEATLARAPAQSLRTRIGPIHDQVTA